LGERKARGKLWRPAVSGGGFTEVAVQVLAVMALMPLKAGRLNEGLRGGLMVGGSNARGVASRGAEWRPEVAGCGGGAAKLRRSQRKVMIGGAHLSAGA
jgi:hypothetical protein